MKKLALAAVVVLLTGCADLVSRGPAVTADGRPIDPVEAKYIEGEKLIKNSYDALAAVGNAELKARGEGKEPGSVISRQAYFQALDRLDDLKEIGRQGRALVGDSSCLMVDGFKSLNMKGCLDRRQIALLIINVLERKTQ